MIEKLIPLTKNKMEILKIIYEKGKRISRILQGS